MSERRQSLFGDFNIQVDVPWWIWILVGLWIASLAADKLADAGWNAGIFPLHPSATISDNGEPA